MTKRRSLVSGDIVAQRYHLQDLVTERLGSTTWRAHDAVLSRNVGLELLPSDDPRAGRFLEAARRSTAVTDPRFLRVLDLIEDDQGHTLVVREWARAFSLDSILGQSPLPSWRAAAVVTEVAEALAHAHSHGQYHRRLTPHQILLKESGAVRVVGLGVATALAPVGSPDSPEEHLQLQRLDVQALGKVLYACLVSRWPGGHVDGLRAAPTEHGRLLRPRQVRAGVEREVDTICDRILGHPPVHHRTPLTDAASIAQVLRRVREPGDETLPAVGAASSPDLTRFDPVVEPAGPPPGLEPPRRRPKAHEPAPPTSLERGRARLQRATQGDRGLVVLGVVGTLLLASIIAYLAGRSSTDEVPAPAPVTSGVVSPLQIAGATDFDPEGTDGVENPDRVPLAIDGDPETGWTTSTYFRRADLGGIKSGVGLVLDLGGPRDVSSLRLRLGGEPTSLSVLASSPTADGVPTDVAGLRQVATIDDAGADVSVALPPGTLTRYVVVWLRTVPQIGPEEFRGEIREVQVLGRG
ncbi:hypothetical protein HMPREF0063_10404 [Aeromicrobium marinum DSM 15272]|uniref:Protein kinase domain-containing protein n=1 Tax=Aeromicrobium marinum DSM 15272 TaxID=585531 RepID=E2S8P7_9ACTN|nr:protein kinase family protein [Aeromicrobium marinum]EFQ84552.1 hypothetical protein HMPREF0063_10404 [Aeromicrobium marinum DSM 15272]